MAEKVISCWKHAVNISLPVKKEEFIMSTVEIFQGKTLQAYRFNVIRDIVTSTSIVIKPKCIAWNHDTTTCLPARLMREEITC